MTREITEIVPDHWTAAVNHHSNPGEVRLTLYDDDPEYPEDGDTFAINMPIGDAYVMCAQIAEQILIVRKPRNPLSPILYSVLIKLLRLTVPRHRRRPGPRI